MQGYKRYYGFHKMDIVKNAAVVSGSVLAVGTGASIVVPAAMATFGTVVPGVGTIHTAGGIAATLQSTSAACTLYTSLLAGAGSIPFSYMRSKL